MRRFTPDLPSSPLEPPSQGERQRFVEQRRLAFLIVGTLGTLMLGYNTVLVLQERPPNLELVVSNNIVFAVIAGLLVGLALLRRFSMDLLEQAAFGLMALESLIFNSLISWLLDWPLSQVFTETITDDVWLLVLVCTLGVHIFPRKVGTRWAVGLYLLSIGIVFSRVWQSAQAGADPIQVNIIVQNYIFGAMVLAFMWVLARYRDQVQRLGLEYELLERVAFLDVLTGLPNRRRMYALLEQHLESAHRQHTPFCVALLDLDHFKRINDSFGHLRGDAALIRVCELIQRDLRPQDQLGRWGGEEFLVLFPDTTLEEARTTLEQIRETIEREADVDGHRLTISGGVTAHQSHDSSSSVVGRADGALYRAKHGGRNRIYPEDEGMPAPIMPS